MPPDIRQVRCGDIKLCLGVAGQGPPLLFLGGTGWDLRATPNPLTSVLTSCFTVALFDQRGQGRSTKPAARCTMQTYAQDALAIADHLGWQAPALVGYSFGGMVAQEYAIRFPSRLSKLVLAATTAGGRGGSSYPVHDLLHLDPIDRARTGLRVSDRRFARLEKHNAAEADLMVQKRMMSQTRFSHEPGAKAGLKAQLSARAAHDCYDRLGHIKVPTLVLIGSDDLQAPFDAQHRMSDRIPGASCVTVAGAHNFLFENDTAYREIMRFLRPPDPQQRGAPADASDH